MKQVFSRFCLFLCICFVASGYLIGQNAVSDVKLMFSRNIDGKVVTMNAVGQKVFDFMVEGIAGEKQANDFVQKFKGKPNVILVNMSVSNKDKGAYKTVIIMDQKARVADFKEILKDAGFLEIYLDDVSVSVDELEVLKIKNHHKNKN
jgi:hypothetical protein